VGVLVIAATNVDLGANVEEGTFRRDLYYRLNVLPITLPSLRVCAADTPALADCFLKLHRGRKAVASAPKPAGV
jgi:transcriptional regulator with PAS, ATPase and Fis domain